MADKILKGSVNHMTSLIIANCPIYSENERIFLDKDIQALEPSCRNISVIVSNFEARYANHVHLITIETTKLLRRNDSLLAVILLQLISQVKLSRALLKIERRADIVLFDIGEFRNIVPLLLAKVLGKKTMVIHRGGNKSLETRLEYSSGFKKIVPPVSDALLHLFYRLVDYILCISQSIVKFGQLEAYENKILIYGGEFVDTKRFIPRSFPSERNTLVGYVGRHSPKKGIINLVRAIPRVLSELSEVNFLIAGEGEQTNLIANEVRSQGNQDRVKFVPWVPDQEYPMLLNELKLLVLPSYEEGTPVTLKEAMACGTIVLATPVGGIPDLVEDGKTGFILRNNSPSCIAETILRALREPRLNEISTEARNVIERHETYAESVMNWKAIIEHVAAGRTTRPPAESSMLIDKGPDS